MALEFLLASLATWRLAHLIAYEDGPWDVICQIRRKAGNGMLGELMDCPSCLSIWVGAPITAITFGTSLHSVVYWFAISGASVFLEKLWDVAARREQRL